MLDGAFRGLLEAERNRNRKAELPSAKSALLLELASLTGLRNGASSHHPPAKFAKGLFKCSSLETAGDEELGSLN